MPDTTRPLRQGEIDILIEQDCWADDFSLIEVAEGFDATRVSHTRFSGKIQIGRLQNTRTLPGNLAASASIAHARLHNCVIGNDVFIHNINQALANMIIADEVIIWNVDSLLTDGETTFGNGTEITVINEAGGREVPIFEELPGQLAYMIALYRHRPAFQDKIKEIIAAYCATLKSDIGYVGRGSILTNCGNLRNLRIGPAATLDGAVRLTNTTINSGPEDPAYIGPAVITENAIISAGAKVTDGVILENCFVGQGVHLKKQFTAENSIFLANFEGFQGEACSLFAGPYTVTHHKSTLLIAGLVSFFNAGSGTNQSNHLYKLGPGLQGVLERGCKTASDGYVMWPARIGPFTLIKGRHYSNVDSSDLPFSYLLEFEGQSFLMPGYNLIGVGPVRDGAKWPRRERRRAAKHLDFIIHDVFSPYTVQKMIDARARLENLLAGSQDSYTGQFEYGRTIIKKSSLENGLQFYRLGIDAYLGRAIMCRLSDKLLNAPDDLIAALARKTGIGSGPWVDLAGLLAPRSLVDHFLSNIENGAITTLEQIHAGLTSMYTDYRDYEWTWTADTLESEYMLELDKITPRQIAEIIEGWLRAEDQILSCRQKDAEKEFAAVSRIGYGLDGDVEVMDADFAAVRGRLEDDSFMQSLVQENADLKTRANEILNRLDRMTMGA